MIQLPMTNMFPRAVYGRYQLKGGRWIEGQKMVRDEQEMFQMITDSNGKCSVFVSHNSYPGHEEDKVVAVKRVRVEYQFYDLDHKTKPENAHLELIKLVEWANSEGEPWEASFSAGKGFHFFLKHTPAVYDLNIATNTDGSSIELRSYYMAAQAWLKGKLGLKCLDLQCAEPKRVHRVWNTMHFSRGSKVPTGRYCIQLSEDQILNWSFEEIVELSKQPQIVTDVWNKDRSGDTFHKYLNKHQIHPFMGSDDGGQTGLVMLADYKPPALGQEKNWEWFKKHMPDPCVHNAMHNSRNPPHIARFASAVLWKSAEIDMGWVDKFYQRMQYADVHQRQNRLANLRSIWNRGPGSNRPHLRPYRYPSCKRLYEGGICVGASCPKFSRYLQSEAIGRSEDPGKEDTEKT